VANALDTAVRNLCLAFPQTEALTSHGSPNFRIQGGKIFATYAENHHGDGRLALWLNVSRSAQQDHVRANPKHFFVPPYVGPGGWLGVRLDRGISWTRVAELVRSAYEHVAPPRLVQTMGATPSVAAPARRITVADIDPKNTPRGRKILKSMRAICLALPDTIEGLQFGQPVWRAGKRAFAQAYCQQGRWRAGFWVGIPAQGLMTADPRYTIPAYAGHNGWISLDIADSHDENELRLLALDSFRHFATKKMLAAISVARLPAKPRARPHRS
jgi:hypothetical protein